MTLPDFVFSISHATVTSKSTGPPLF